MEPPIVRSPQPPISLKFLFVIIVILLLAIAWVGYQLYKTQLSSFLNQASPTPALNAPSQISSSYDNCSMTKDRNPLVAQLLTEKDSTGKITEYYGFLRANINSVQIGSSGSGVINLELVSSKTEEQYTFKVPDREGLVTTSSGGKLKPSQLRAGEQISVSFQCFPANELGKKFVITDINIKK